MESVENTVLRNLILNEEYNRKVLPFIKPEYFENQHEKVIFEETAKFIVEYDRCPTQEIISIECEKRKDINDETFKTITTYLNDLDTSPTSDDWLVDTTEKWCKERAIYLALVESISIADGHDIKKGVDAIPSILSDALAVGFDNHVGHDYLEDYSERYDFYHTKEDRIEFDLEFFNKITKGGIPNKTLNIALAGTGVGKSLFMCHVASSVLLQGKNVLYITLEMAEEKIAERVDANLLNVPVQQLTDLPRIMFENKVSSLAKKTQGQLIIKEYPTASAHVGHFRALLNELALKKSFTPDIIFVDYLNICASVRYKGAIVNSYTYVKAIAEELRGLAVEHNLPIVSATQTTRSGYGNSDPDLTDTSESFGLPATADLMFALISTEELEQQGRIMVKQLKNRYNDPTSSRKFMVGIDRSKMRLYDVAEDASVLSTDESTEEQFTETKNRLSKFSEWNV